MLWHIELKFCIWLCFTVLHIKFECRQIALSFVGVMPLLDLRILEIHSIPHFSDIMLWHIKLKFYIWLCLMYYRSSSSVVNSHRFLVHLIQRLKCTIVITRCRSSVDRKLSHFQLLLWNLLTEFNETWQDARSQRLLPSLCFSGQWQKQDGRPSLWLAETFSTSFLKLLNRIQRNLTGSKISTSSTKFVFFGPVWKKRWQPWPLIGWDIFDFFSEIAERNSTKLDRKQDLNVLYQVCVFLANLKTRWRPWPLISWDIFYFFSEIAERNSTKLDRKQDLNIFDQVCVIGANRKNKMAALASDGLRHFRLLWNRWTEFNKTWQEARSQRLLPSLCFSGRSEK